LDSDAHYAVKTANISSFFYLEKNKQKLAFLDRREFGLIPKGTGVKSILVEKFLASAKKLKFQTSGRNKLAYVIFKEYRLFGKKVEVPAHFPLDMADFLRKNGAKLVPTYPFFPERAIKSKPEIGFIKESLKHTRGAFGIIEKILANSKIKGSRIYYENKMLTSEYLKQEAEKALIEKGMFDLLGMIISTGEQTTTPHHDGTGPILPHRPIVCDIFPRHRKSGYYADMTRTYVKGKPDSKLEKMHVAVFKAQRAATSKIRAGISAAEVYQAAADSILRSGFDVGETGFLHGLGHGVGLDIHEAPSLKATSKDILEAGNIITVEPGLYYPEIGGIRIEDMVLVTKKSCQNLTNYPKKLVIP
jgi:Xaa-Pro aminopeptidase